MSKSLAALLAAFSFILLVAPATQATPAEVGVRIEGKTETLFEGPVLTDGHNVKGIGDSEAPAWGRRCNGLNRDANPFPGPTPTAASVDAMAILGEGFDGNWYGADSFDDYFITQWGPERQSVGEGDYWGLLVNNVFTSVGGCQYQVDAGDEVMWVYDAFDGRPQLVLYPGDYSGGSVRLTAKASLEAPFEVTVVEWGAECCDGGPPPSPTRGTTAFEGAEVGPVVPTVRGFERVDTASAETVETGADGNATIIFHTPGWHRIKATALSAGKEIAIRSNRVDVCVPEPPAADCGPAPAEDQVRQAPSSDLEEEPGQEEPEGEPKALAGGGEDSGAAPIGETPARAAGKIKIALRDLDKSRLAAGIVGVSWRVQDSGPGISHWSVSVKKLGSKGGFVTKATGRSKSSAQVRLAQRGRFLLRLTVIDLLGRSLRVSLGTVRIPD